MYDGRWMFTSTTGTRHVEPFNAACVIIGVRGYDVFEIDKIITWLADRAAGYPSLAQFEGGANWPRFDAHDWFLTRVNCCQKIDFIFHDRSGDLRDL